MARPRKVKSTGGKKKGQGLYQTPLKSPRNYRPRYYVSAVDTPQAVTSYDRLDSITLAREMFTTCPDLGGALLQKASWVVGPGSYRPIYTGKNTEWGDIVEEWLVTQFYPVCSVLGPNYPFESLLTLSTLAIDVDGDSGMYLTSTKGGFPQVGLIASHRIGQRTNEKVVKEGKFAGYTIVDGVILSDDGRPIAYRVLGNALDGSDDKDISASNLQLLIEPEWSDQVRGISRVARSLTDWSSQDQINEFLLRGAKLASSVGLIHKTESGDGSDSGFAPGSEEDPLAPGNSGAQVTAVNGGEIYFMKASANESLEALKNENPSQNTEAFISRIQKRALYSIGFPQEMMDPSKIGGASVRLVQDLVRRSIATRQQTIERRAKLIVNYAVAKAMKEELIPRNNEDWFKFSFTKGAMLTVDQGNEQSALREGFKLGTTTLQEMSAQKGADWYELRNQTQKETEDLLDRATVLSKKYNITLDAALALLSQRTPNQAPVSQLEQTEEDTTEDNATTEIK